MNTDLLVALAAGLPGALFAVWIVLTGEASIRRARSLTVEAALGDVGRSLRDLRRSRARN